MDSGQKFEDGTCLSLASHNVAFHSFLVEHHQFILFCAKKDAEQKI